VGKGSRRARADRFAPLPGLPTAGTALLESGCVRDLHALYGGLGSGRLIVIGAPGSGKSGAAVLLILTALRYRDQASVEDREKIPIPVLVTAQDWDPNRELVPSWLAREIHVTYPQLSPLADADAVNALLTAAAAHQGLRGSAAIQLQPVSSTEAASYLERVQLDPPPDGWHELAQYLRHNPASPLSKALDNPLALSLVRDTCQSEKDARNLLAFSATLSEIPVDQGTAAVTDYLLDRVLTAAYTRQPGQPPLTYDLATAQNALTKIAARMSHQGTRDLYWWHIPTWASRTQRRIASKLVVGLAAGLMVGIAVGIAVGIIAGLADGLPAGLVVGLVASFIVGFWLKAGDGAPPRRTTKLQFLKVLRWNSLINPYAVVVGFDLGLGIGWSDPAPGVVVGLGTGLPIGLGLGLPVGLLTGLGFGLIVGLLVALNTSQSWPAFLASVQIAIKWRTPVRLMRFLEDAHSRNVLRTVGPAYQFRHARLQDRLADAASFPGEAASVRAAEPLVTAD
jgi:F0F1-type ATP synthase assembly protein I